MYDDLARWNTTGTDGGFEVGGGDVTPHVLLDHGRSATEARDGWPGIARRVRGRDPAEESHHTEM